MRAEYLERFIWQSRNSIKVTQHLLCVSFHKSPASTDKYRITRENTFVYWKDIVALHVNLKILFFRRNDVILTFSNKSVNHMPSCVTRHEYRWYFHNISVLRFLNLLKIFLLSDRLFPIEEPSINHWDKSSVYLWSDNISIYFNSICVQESIYQLLRFTNVIVMLMCVQNMRDLRLWEAFEESRNCFMVSWVNQIARLPRALTKNSVSIVILEQGNGCNFEEFLGKFLHNKKIELAKFQMN